MIKIIEKAKKTRSEGIQIWKWLLWYLKKKLKGDLDDKKVEKARKTR